MMSTFTPHSDTKRPSSTIFIIDDDKAIQEGLDTLFRSAGYNVQIASSAAEFLKEPFQDIASCLVLDIKLPGLSGLELQKELATRNFAIPIVFMTGYGDIPMTVNAIQRGAVDFLEKPFRPLDMLEAVRRALKQDRTQRLHAARTADLRTAYGTLSFREREVMASVVRGLMNKQVAALLDLKEITVKQHRGRLMKKMGVSTLADLVRAAEIVTIENQASDIL